MRGRWAIAWAVAGMLGGCYTGLDFGAWVPPVAQADDSGAPGGSGDDGDDGDDDADADPAAPECGSGRTGLRRLTREQYDNTVRDLLGVDLGLAAAFDADATVGPFASNVGTAPTPILVDQYRLAAETLADAADLATLVGCDADTQGESCAQQFVVEFGRRAFRRPLTSDEVEHYVGLWEVGADPTPSDGIRLVVAALLQSPHFLYLVEEGEEDPDSGLQLLRPHELVTRLAYFMWNTTPDDTLLAWADDASTSDVDAIEDLAGGMLEDGRADGAIESFHRQWLGTEVLRTASKRPDLFPEFDETLVEEMLAETGAFTSWVIRHDDARFDTLLTASYTVATPSIAALYGLDPNLDADGLLQLDPKERAGILTQPAFLAAHASSTESSFIRRGKFIVEDLVCGSVPPPPEDVVDGRPDEEDADGLPPRQVWERHLKDPECRACHMVLDPPGFAFEHYDGLGRYRHGWIDIDLEGEGGVLDPKATYWPVDASGELRGLPVDAEFDDAIDLLQGLAGNEDVQTCFASHWLRFAIGREMTDDDACTLDAVVERFRQTDGDIRELILEIVRSDAFRALEGGVG